MNTIHPNRASDDGTSQDDQEGLRFDTDRLLAFGRPVPRIGRRRALRLFGGAGAIAVLAACDRSASSQSSSAAASAQPTTSATSAATGATAATTAATTTTTTAFGTTADSTVSVTAGDEIPDETGGPYPGDGTNGPNALADSGVVRSDIRSSFGSASGTADGIPLTVQLTVAEAATGAPLPGAAVYLWHCTRDGGYSMYSNGITRENYLRGVQVADDNGVLQFTTIFPGCYPGRWPHAHFEVYSSLDQATDGRQAIKTSQLAVPEGACAEAYAVVGYEASGANLARVSLDSDNVFADGVTDQLVTVSGNPTNGYSATLLVRI